MYFTVADIIVSITTLIVRKRPQSWSIITPQYNRVHLSLRAVHSVQRQYLLISIEYNTASIVYCPMLSLSSTEAELLRAEHGSRRLTRVAERP